MAPPISLFLTEPLRAYLSHPENVLGRKAYRVVSARNGDVAVEVLKALQPRLVVLDAGEFLEGLDACRRLKEGNETRALVVLMALRGEEAAHADAARQAGADDVLVGTFSPEDLLVRIAELLAVPLSQRRHVRALFGVSFDGRSVSGTFLGNTVNVSESGMLVEADAELAVDDRIECRFFLPGDQRPVDVKGKVVRRAPEVQGQMPAFGVVFQSVSDEDLARLRRFVATQGS
jgi:CheY-like chemotaxis protein